MIDKERAKKLAEFVYEVNDALWGVRNLYTKHANQIIEGYHEAFRQAIIEMFIGLPQRMPYETWFGDENLPRKHWAEQISTIYDRYQAAVQADAVQENAVEKQLAALAKQVEQLSAKLTENDEQDKAEDEEKKEPEPEAEPKDEAKPEEEKKPEDAEPGEEA